MRKHKKVTDSHTESNFKKVKNYKITKYKLRRETI